MRSLFAFLLCLLLGCSAEKPEPQVSADDIAFKKALQQLKDKTGATLDWQNRITNKVSPFYPPFLIDLQREWLSGVPVVFPGRLTDVGILTDGSYAVTVEGRSHSSLWAEADTILKLNCSAESFGATYGSFSEQRERDTYGLPGSVFVVANIKAVDRVGDQFVGTGTCAAALWVPELFVMPSSQ